MTVKKIRRLLSLFLVITAVLGSCGLSAAEETPAPVYPDGWQRYELPSGGTRTSPYIYYWVYTPAEMKPGLPLVVYLHSTGGMINSAIKKTEKGLPWMIVNGDVPPPECIVLVPQHPGGEFDFWDSVLDSVIACVDKVIEDYKVDRSRIALTGFSLGGIGMWDLVAAKPGIYSRLLCVEGKVNRESQVPELFEGCEVILYTAHRDLAINTASAINFVDRLNEAGIPATHIQLENAHQEVPGIVYTDESIQEWLWIISALVKDPVTDQPE